MRAPERGRRSVLRELPGVPRVLRRADRWSRTGARGGDRPGRAPRVGDADPARDQRQRPAAANGCRRRAGRRSASPRRGRAPVGDAEDRRACRPRRRTGDERAAALVAKPDALQPPDGGKSVTASAPEAQRPQAALRDPKVTKQAPSRKINPGDLVCGVCGEGNDPQRNYCRRCGSTLAEATVAKTRWYQRRKSKKVVAAGDRPGQPGRSTSGGGAGRKARVVRGKFLGRFADFKRILAILAIVGIGVGFVVPSIRTWVTDTAVDGFDKVKGTVSPEYTNIPVDPARDDVAIGRDSGRQRPPTSPTATRSRTGWPRRRRRPPSVSVGFVEPTDVEHVLVHPGQQEDGGKVVRPDPRPR